MAKRKRRSASLGHITAKEMDELEYGMNRAGAREYEYIQRGQKVEADIQRSKLAGMLDASRALGMECMCFPVTDAKVITQCVCAKTWEAAEKKADRKVAAYSQIRRRPRR